ncbi:hypothetical protein niasHS_010771 [Heterodera schachtii]|uniref:Exostosin GT47 domain-containing protein n=1 Tax=Heterodera schachtii TaxID=97005 RepID=A0ABD2ISI1_HETSC
MGEDGVWGAGAQNGRSWPTRKKAAAEREDERMGNEQSQSREERPRKLPKQNNGEPNENIQVMKSGQNTTNDLRTRELDKELTMQRERNKQLTEQLRTLEEKRAVESASAAVSAAVSAVKTIETSARNSKEEEIEEKRRIFEETAKRLEETFLSRHWPDACADEQKEIVGCLAKFPGKVLSCHSLLDIYRKCINNFRMKLIDEQNDEFDVHANFSFAEFDWAETAAKWSKCSLSECIALERCLFHPNRRLSIYVQPILRNGEKVGCATEPTEEFLQIRRIIRQSVHFEADPSLSCFVLPGFDFTRLTECPPKRFFALSELSRSILPSNSNFVFVNLLIAHNFLTVPAPFPGIFISAQHSRHSLRPGFDLAIPLPLPHSDATQTPSADRRSVHILVILPSSDDWMRDELIRLFGKKSPQSIQFVQKCATDETDLTALGSFCGLSRELPLPPLESLISMSNITLISDGILLPQSLVWLALRFGSVPALISDNFVLPFSDSIDWHRFSFHFAPSILHELPNIFLSVPSAQLDRMRSAGFCSFSSHFSSLRRIVSSTIASLEARIIPGKSMELDGICKN